jgi:ketosteroid isomerase-like protein
MISNEIARNFDVVGTFYAGDAQLQAANMPVLAGRQAIVEGYRGFFADTLEFEASVAEVVAAESGDVAFEWGTNRVVVDAPEGPVELIGKYSRGWKKVEGVWLVQLQTYSPDVAPPA